MKTGVFGAVVAFPPLSENEQQKQFRTKKNAIYTIIEFGMQIEINASWKLM
jgi:hypothetical protein